jgi:hypothetical protein
MRNKTKKLTSIRLMPVLALALLVVLGSALAEPARNPVCGFGSSVLNLATGESSGQVTLFVRGEELLADLSVTDVVMVFSDEGVMHATALSTLDFGDGNTLTTEDKIVAEPAGPGLFTVNEALTIISGTGAYEGARGRLSVHGQMQFVSETEAVVTYEVRGVISR